MSAYAQILAVLDRAAKVRQNALANASGGSNFWALVDAAGDETFENRVKGSDITAVDTELASGAYWSTTGLRKLFSHLESYFIDDLGYAKAGTTPAMAAYLAAVGGARVPYHAAECLYDALTTGSTGIRLPAVRVFPKGTRPADGGNPGSAGMHLLGTFTATATFAAGDGALPATVGPAGILAINMSAAQSVGGTFRCTNYVAATYKDLALSLSGADQYTQTILGEEAVASAVTAGDLAVQVASTAAFTAGEYVLVYEDDATQELMLVDSLGTGPTRLVTTTALKNAYTTSAVVIPLFRSVTFQSGGSGTGDVRLYALPDRTISLGS